MHRDAARFGAVTYQETDASNLRPGARSKSGFDESNPYAESAALNIESKIGS